MGIALKRPVLVGGLGLTAGLWLLDVVEQSPVDSSMMMGAIALGSGLWWLKNLGKPTIQPWEKPAPADRAAVEAALAEVNTVLETLATEAELQPSSLTALESQIATQRQAQADILQGLDRTDLTLAITGGKAVGKSALAAQLTANWLGQHTLLDVDEGQTAALAAADLVLFVASADLTDSEFQHIRALVGAGHQALLVFNKQDQYAPMERAQILQRMQGQMAELGIDGVAIATVPSPIKVRRHQLDGEIEETFEQPAPELDALTAKLTEQVEQNTQSLVMATALRQAKALKGSVQTLLNGQRRQRALPLVEQAQWIAAGTAFASPLPTLDLLATTAINAQLILDLGAVYGQKFSLEQAKAAAGTLAELTVKLGLVELTSQALSGLLKSHAVTYVAGGVLQGVSAAYLTHLGGLSLIDFFETQSQLAPSQRQFTFANLGPRLQALFQQARQGMGLQMFAQQALKHLPSSQAGLSAETPAAS